METEVEKKTSATAVASVQSEREEVLSRCEINGRRPLLESTRDTLLLFSVAKGRVPIQVGPILRMGRMTALLYRRRWSSGHCCRRGDPQTHRQTIAQQLGPGGGRGPFQYALSTRAGCECTSYSDRVGPDDSTIMSVDGISAYTVSQGHAGGQEKVPGGGAVLPKARDTRH